MRHKTFRYINKQLDLGPEHLSAVRDFVNRQTVGYTPEDMAWITMHRMMLFTKLINMLLASHAADIEELERAVSIHGSNR